MHAGWRWLFAGSLVVPVFIACGSSNSALSNGQDVNGDDDSSSSSGSQMLSSGGGSGGPSGFHYSADALPMGTMVASSACKAGFYQGTFTGDYSSHITVVGLGIPVTGNVELTLNQVGSSDKTCTIVVEGEGNTQESCNNVFTLSGGVISGTADGVFPYYCTMTGTLDCGAKPVLDNGWIECTYCAFGVILDGSMAAGDPLANCTGAGGNFAGPLKANYDTSTLSFTAGSWNGAEVLCNGIAGTSTATCNDGGSPGPEGGPATNYLVADGGYGLAPNFGGAGGWGATCLNCEKD
jgi:hypothetical protein